VLREAEALELPLRVVDGSAGDALSTPVVTVDHPGVTVSAVKRADDGSGDLIVRLYEACGDRVEVALYTTDGIRSAQWCNALEEPLSAIDVTDTFLAVPLRPFQLATLRLQPGTRLPAS
jgi:alpha-mannosidase